MRCRIHSLVEPCADCATRDAFAESLRSPIPERSRVEVLTEKLKLARHYKARRETIERIQAELAEARRSA